MKAILRNKVECEVFQFNNDMNVFNGKNIKVELDDKGIVSIVHKVKIPVLKCDYIVRIGNMYVSLDEKRFNEMFNIVKK